MKFLKRKELGLFCGQEIYQLNRDLPSASAGLNKRIHCDFHLELL